MVDSFKLLEGVCIPSQRVAPSSLTALKDGVSNRSQFLNQNFKVGAPGRSRTRDLRFTKPLLYQLSYKGKTVFILTRTWAKKHPLLKISAE
jgi:hypothetical protein